MTEDKYTLYPSSSWMELHDIMDSSPVIRLVCPKYTLILFQDSALYGHYRIERTVPREERE